MPTLNSVISSQKWINLSAEVLLRTPGKRLAMYVNGNGMRGSTGHQPNGDIAQSRHLASWRFTSLHWKRIHNSCVSFYHPFYHLFFVTLSGYLKMPSLATNQHIHHFFNQLDQERAAHKQLGSFPRHLIGCRHIHRALRWQTALSRIIGAPHEQLTTIIEILAPRGSETVKLTAMMKTKLHQSLSFKVELVATCALL